MRECGYRKGCWQTAFGDDKFCYWHEKVKNPPIKSGTERDLWTSEAIAIRQAQGMLELARKILQPEPGHSSGKPKVRTGDGAPAPSGGHS